LWHKPLWRKLQLAVVNFDLCQTDRSQAEVRATGFATGAVPSSDALPISAIDRTSSPAEDNNWQKFLEFRCAN
jgi:hypothetical protein